MCEGRRLFVRSDAFLALRFPGSRQRKGRGSLRRTPVGSLPEEVVRADYDQSSPFEVAVVVTVNVPVAPISRYGGVPGFSSRPIST